MKYRAPDARICLLLLCVMGTAIWRVPAWGLCLHCALVAMAFVSPLVRSCIEPGMIRRSFTLALFWAALKFLFDVPAYLWSLYGEVGELPAVALLAPPVFTYGYEAMLLFFRLFALMLAALALTLVFSTRSLALALSWYLRPLGRQRAWKPALAFALMAQYLPRIHRALAASRIAARSRRLPHTGLAYWKLAFPQLFRILAESTWAQAVGIAGRNLDQDKAWRTTSPLAFSDCLAGIVLAVLLLLPLASV